jgi:hypothetical protein
MCAHPELAIPQLTLQVALEPDSVAIRFRDNGPGIPDSEGLFKPFGSQTGGAGLGLYVSRAVLKSFGGDLDRLYANAGLEMQDLRAHASAPSLDLDRFASCLEERKHRTAVEQDLLAGRSAGISGTPAFFINGVPLMGAEKRAAQGPKEGRLPAADPRRAPCIRGDRVLR